VYALYAGRRESHPTMRRNSELEGQTARKKFTKYIRRMEKKPKIKSDIFGLKSTNTQLNIKRNEKGQ
jgi:hypothetical protein